MSGRIAWLVMNGEAPDLIPSEAPPDVWTRVSDMIFRGFPERITGRMAYAGAPLFDPNWVLSGKTSAEEFAWIYTSADGVGVTDGSLHTDITPAAGWEMLPYANPWTGGVLNSVAVFGSGTFWHWRGEPTAQPLPGWPVGVQALAMRPYQYHLVAMGIIDAGTLDQDAVQWSAAAEPGTVPATWTPAPDNQAGGVSLAQTGGTLVDGAALRQSFILYKSTSTYVMDYVGGASVMNVRLLFPSVGLLARNCVAQHRGAHFLLTDGDVVMNDGQRITSIADRLVRRRIFAYLDAEAFKTSFVVSDEARGDVWFCVPESGNPRPNVAHIFNVDTGKWGRRELPELPAHIGVGTVRIAAGPSAWADYPIPWEDRPQVWGLSSGRVSESTLLEASPGVPQLYTVDLDPTRDGAGIAGVLEREYLDLGEPDRVKTARRIWMTASGSPGQRLAVSVGSSTSLAEPMTYSPPVEYVIGSSRKVDAFATGYFLSVRIEGVVDGVQRLPWRLGRLGIEYERRGMF